MSCSAAPRGLAKIVVVGSFVIGLTIVTAGSSWADSSAPSPEKLAQHASRSAVVFGIPVSTASWALLGLLVVGAAMVITSRSRHQVLAGLRAQSTDEKVGAVSKPSVVDLVSRGIDPVAEFAESHLEAGRTLPAVS